MHLLLCPLLKLRNSLPIGQGFVLFVGDNYGHALSVSNFTLDFSTQATTKACGPLVNAYYVIYLLKLYLFPFQAAKRGRQHLQDAVQREALLLEDRYVNKTCSDSISFDEDSVAQHYLDR